jgi:hypothetical protein
VSNDISAQGFAGKPTNPNPTTIAGGGPIKTQKSESAMLNLLSKAEADANYDLTKSYHMGRKIKLRNRQPVGLAPQKGFARVDAVARGASPGATPTQFQEDPQVVRARKQQMERERAAYSAPFPGWQSGQKYNFYGAHSNTFRLGNSVFEVPEEEVDEYRSGVGQVARHPAEGERLSGFFPTPVDQVTVEPLNEEYQDPEYDDTGNESRPERPFFHGHRLVGSDGHEWLRYGSSGVDTYYPYFSFQYNPRTGTPAKKAETTMKLHDLMKAQGDRAKREQGEHGGSPKRPYVPDGSGLAGGDLGRTGSGARPHGSYGGPVTDEEKSIAARFPTKKAEETPGESHGSEETSSPESSVQKAEYHPTPSYQSSRDVTGPHPDGSSLSPNKPSHPFSDPKRPTTGGATKSEESPTDRSHGPMPVIKTSIFKKAPEGLGKAETHAHANAKRNGGTIKLGKQEFYIDLANASDPKKRLKETNPVKESVVPGGKETGWDSNGPKPKVVERSASGGAISANKPKPGPDQKNNAENSVVEGAASKSSGKNDLIEKAAASWHKRNPNGGLAKAAGAMAAPKAPTAAGAGSPTLSAKPPAKPPQAGAHANPPMGKALMPFSAQQEAQKQAGGVLGTAPAAAAAPKATPKPPSAYDPSLYAPSAPVKSGLFTHGELHQPPPGTGVTPQPAMKLRSPAMVKNIQNFGSKKPMVKAELCKACGKAHPMGKCQ